MSEEAIAEKNLGNEAYKKLDFVNAHKHYDAAIVISPNNIIFYSNKAAVFFQEREFQKCIDECIKAIEIGRENQADPKVIAKAMTRIGNAFLKLQSYKDSISWFKQSLSAYYDPEIADKLKETREKYTWNEKIYDWIKYNANPKMALKLMKCHSFFRHQECPFLVVKSLTFTGMGINNWHYDDLANELHSSITMDNIEGMPKKFWITESFWINPKAPNFLSNFLPKIAACDAKKLSISDQNISYDEFQIFVSSGNAESLQLINTTISYVNGVPLSVDKILECAPKLKHFFFGYNNGHPYVIPGFYAKIIDKINTSIMTSFALSGINSFSDFEVFLEFMNKNPRLHVTLTFNNCLSVEETKILQNYVDRIIATGITKNNYMYKPSRMRFFGQNAESREKFDRLCGEQASGFFMFPV
uniref:Uncharacterized protein n=1 Tax=Panagrolaimus sp. ES5 TaxID=591445 RepID=A0AC34FY17_9BILA